MIHLKLKIKNVHNNLLQQPAVLVDLGVCPFSVSEETASMKANDDESTAALLFISSDLRQRVNGRLFLDIHTNGQLPAGQEALNSFLFEGK